MSAAELKELKKEVKKYIDSADEKTVKIICAMLEAEAAIDESEYQLDAKQIAELERRLELDRKGKMEYSPWKEVEQRIKTRVRNAI